MSTFSYTHVLAIFYGLLWIFEFIQLLRKAYYRHKIRSFQVAFLSLCWLWSTLRVIFFAYAADAVWTSKNDVVFTILYWSPINVQFATYSLLIVFYAHLHHTQKSEFKEFKSKFGLIYGVSNLFFFVVEATLVVLGAIYDEGAVSPPWLINTHRIFSGTVFFVLTLVIGYNGFQVARNIDQSTAQTKLIARLSFRRIMVVSIGLFILFTLRAIYDFVTTFDSKLSLNINMNVDAQQVLVFVAFTLWEVIPAVLVLTLFGRVDVTSLGALNMNRTNAFNYSNRSTNYQKFTGETPRESGKTIKADLFNDPKRYDSDEETTSLRQTPSPNYGYGAMNGPYGTPIANVNGDLAT